MTHEAVDLVAPLAASNRLSLTCTSEGSAHACCDRARVAHVLATLLGNSLKYTRDGGSIRAAVEVIDGEVVFSVTDDGVGIPASLASHLFERFSRESGAGRARHGLRLPLAKAIVEAHGGRMWMKSVEGQGATFYFALPADAAKGKARDDG